MNTDKYLELLRFYLTDKISEISDSLKQDIEQQIDTIISTIVAAILSVYISSDFISANGICAVGLKLISVVVLWAFLSWIIKKIFQYRKSSKALNECEKHKLPQEKVKRLVDMFDHITCDGVLLAWDFLKKYDSAGEMNTSEKEFYLIEAFYYYRKALQIGSRVVAFSEQCVNDVSVDSGVAKYRLKNICEALTDISLQIQNRMNAGNYTGEFEFEFSQANEDLRKIQVFLNES